MACYEDCRTAVILRLGYDLCKQSVRCKCMHAFNSSGCCRQVLHYTPFSDAYQDLAGLSTCQPSQQLPLQGWSHLVRLLHTIACYNKSYLASMPQSQPGLCLIGRQC